MSKNQPVCQGCKREWGAGVTAAVTVTGEGLSGAKEMAGKPRGLLPLADRPFLRHLAEALAERGVNAIAVIVPPEYRNAVYEVIGDGALLGVTVSYHSVDDGLDAQDVLAAAIAQSGAVLVGPGERFCLESLTALLERIEGGECAAPGIASARYTGELDGWLALPCGACASGAVLSAPAGGIVAAQALGMAFYTAAQDAMLFDAQTIGSLLASNHAAVGEYADKLRVSGREVAAGVRIGNQARVHPTATLIQPVFVGAHARIGAGCTIGPGVVVGDGVLIEEQTSLRHSVVAPCTYVGKELELEESVVDGSLLASARQQVVVKVADGFLLDRIGDGPMPPGKERTDWLLQRGLRAIARWMSTEKETADA